MQIKNLKYKIGCSGYHYPEWVGAFYPEKLPKTKWLEYYSEKYDTVEINATFYRTMKPAFFVNIYKRTPPEFQFSVKASRYVTHYNKFNNVKEKLSVFYNDIITGLKEKLGCVLFQCPPGYTYKEEFLEKIIKNLDPTFNNVVEFRHPSWWKKEVYETLKQNNISFCTTSYPGIPDDLIINHTIVYIRLHGVPHLYTSPYSTVYLNRLAKELNTEKNVQNVFIYFDNTASSAAVKNANQMKKILCKNA